MTSVRLTVSGSCLFLNGDGGLRISALVPDCWHLFLPMCHCTRGLLTHFFHFLAISVFSSDVSTRMVVRHPSPYFSQIQNASQKGLQFFFGFLSIFSTKLSMQNLPHRSQPQRPIDVCIRREYPIQRDAARQVRSGQTKPHGQRHMGMDGTVPETTSADSVPPRKWWKRPRICQPFISTSHLCSQQVN